MVSWIDKEKRGRKKLNFLGDLSPIRRGEVNTPPAKKVAFFRQSAKNTLHALKKPVVFPLSNTGSKEISIKKKKKVGFIFLSPTGFKWGRRGVRA